MQQFGSLFITQITFWLLCRIWWQGKISLVKEDCFCSLSPMKGRLLISIIMLPNAIFPITQVIAKPGMFNFRIKASVSSKLMMIHHMSQKKVEIPITSQYMKIESDWHVKLYNSQWNEVKDVLTGFIGSCGNHVRLYNSQWNGCSLFSFVLWSFQKSGSFRAREHHILTPNILPTRCKCRPLTYKFRELQTGFA